MFSDEEGNHYNPSKAKRFTVKLKDQLGHDYVKIVIFVEILV